MKILVVVLILFAALVNLAPVMGVLSAGRLEALYGVVIPGPDLEILMRHRALLFGVVGTLLAVSAFHAPLRSVAYVAGFFSMLSYIAIVGAVGGANDPLTRIAWIDAVAVVALGSAFAIDRSGLVGE